MPCQTFKAGLYIGAQVGWVTFALYCADRARLAVPFQHANLGAGVAAATLVVFTAILAAPWPIGPVAWRYWIYRATVAMLTGTTGFVALVSAFTVWQLVPITGRAMVTVVAAGAEEVVFRGIIPGAHYRVLQTAGITNRTRVILAIVIAQGLFAIAHVLPFISSARPGMMSELVRLFLVGILYAGIVSMCGIGVAIAVHATLNYEIGVLGTFSGPVDPFVFVSVSGLALLLLWKGDTANALVELVSDHNPCFPNPLPTHDR